MGHFYNFFKNVILRRKNILIYILNIFLFTLSSFGVICWEADRRQQEQNVW